jgi:glycosyltransferase involved in cell wall biosynthesis/2-polyprenyl-3-methyl-5-hydroxy-6-metoxy-1,4-benzoquinol methylase
MTLRLSFYIDSVPITAGVIAGTASLGGSESACIGLMRALSARGHDVHCFANRLDEACYGKDHGGVTWHPADSLYEISDAIHWDVFTSLRMVNVFEHPIKARLKLLWNQDMLVGEQAKLYTMALAWQIDHVAYVSEYHRKQWEGMLPDLKPLGLVVKNGYDATLVAKDVAKDWKRLIYISRPERALEPLLKMWPELKKRVPEAELRICRYQSMYDGEGSNVKAMCDAYDGLTVETQDAVGGITWLGSLGKADLYREIAEASVMWYPGVAGFAETSCVAAIEAQANGTPLVGSYKGALPETLAEGAGYLVHGDAMQDEAYQRESIERVVAYMEGCRDKRKSYRNAQMAGREHVKDYSYAAVAEQWDTMLHGLFKARYEANKLHVLRAFLHEDDHTAAKLVAQEILRDYPADSELGTHVVTPETTEALTASLFCDRVIAGKDQSAETYAAHALGDPLVEFAQSGRFHQVAEVMAVSGNVLDVACGNGAFAIGFAQKYPHARVVGVDYAQGNIEVATRFAERAGVADRCTFYTRAVWDMDTQDAPAQRLDDLVAKHGPFDGLFAGEILEHIANANGFVDTMESYVAPGAKVVFTVPNGPFVELRDRELPLYKGHVHHFEQDDVAAVFGLKGRFHANYWSAGSSERGHSVGHWLIECAAHEGGPARPRNYAHRLLTQRPKVTLTVGMIVKDAENDLGRCLSSVWGIADEIVIGDTGSRDDTKAIAAKYGAKIIDLPPVHQDPEGFSGARNKVLAAATGTWFLWIDADEILLGAFDLWKYLDANGGVFRGFQLHQTHLMVDAFPNADKPVRLFRIGEDVKFYGCVHEQPQQGGVNGDVWPVLDLNSPLIAHTGYITEGLRRRKMLERNRHLLIRDQQVFPERRLGKLLWVREFSQMGQMAEEKEGLSARAKHFYAQAIGLYEQEFADPTDKFHALGRPFYEAALSRVTGAIEFELALAGAVGGFPKGSKAKAERIIVRQLADLRPLLLHKLDKIEAQHRPVPIDVEPVAAGSSATSSAMTA